MKRDEFFPGREPLDVTDVVDKRSATPATDCALVMTPHPITLAGQRVLDAQQVGLMPGETLSSLLLRHGVVVERQWIVSIGGVEVPEVYWTRVRPKHGHLIEARRVPQGGDTLRTVAIIALMVYAPQIAFQAFGGSMSAAAFAATTFGKFATIGIMMAGSMVINKLLAPKLPDAAGAQARIGATSSPTYSISGGRNRARQFETMPLMLGQPYCVPDLAAQPYTYFANGEQHLWQLFHAGLNCAAVDTIRIGQTPVGNYLGVNLSYAGFASGNTGLPLLSNVDSVAGALLDAPSGSGPLVTRTSSVNATQLAVDIEGNLYSVNSTNGAYENLSCDITLEYRLVGSGTWLPFVGSVATITLNSASTKPLRLTYTRQVAAGQYEVQARKVTANVTASNQQNSIQWSTLKTYQVDNGSYKGESRFGIQVQASGQLNGSLDEVNCMGTAKPMPYWNGSAWVTATTRANGLSNPGAQILLLARGIYDEDGRLLAGLGLPDSQIDIESLKLFMVWCAAKGFTFDYFLQETMSIGDLIDAIAAVGMGEKSYHTGKLGVIWFSDEQPVESVLNMGTIKAKSFSVEYDTQATADELEFQYFDRDRNNTWKSIRVLAPGVTMPVATARHPLTGVTTEAHAAVLARFHMAQNVYQRKTVNNETDLEHLTFRRGTVIALSHDMTQWGYGGRVKAAVNSGGTVTLTLDDVVPAVGPGGASSRYMGLRIPGESQYRVFPVQAFSGSSRALTLASAWPSGVPVPGDSADNPAWDTVWIYDFKSTPGQKLRVTQIIPNGNMGGAKVALVPESAEFWNYVWTGAYTPPPNNSLLQGAPVVTGVTVSELLARQGNTYYTELTATIDVTGSFRRAELWGVIGSGPKQLLATSTNLRLSWRGGLAEVWNLEVRTYSGIYVGTPFPLTYTVLGLAVAPPQFDTFMVMVQPDGTRQFNFGYTTTPKPGDWIGAEIRYLRGSVASPVWDDMLPINAEFTHYTASPVETNQLLSGVHTFACRSRDTSGNLSTQRVVEVDLPDRRLGNVAGEWDEDGLLWPGTVGNGWVNVLQNEIEATDSTTWATLPATWDGWTRWNMSPASPLTYTAPIRDFGVVLRGLLSIDLICTGIATLELRTSNDNVTWSGWVDASLAFNARYIQLRVSVTAGSTVPSISALTYRVSADVMTEALNDVDITGLGAKYLGTGDCRIPLVNAYSIITRLQVVIQDSSAGAWTWQRVDNLATGPRIQFKLNGTLANPAYVDFYIEGY